MFVIANLIDASLFQRAPTRARQIRRCGLRQHGPALTVRRRVAPGCRAPRGLRTLASTSWQSSRDRNARLVPGNGVVAPLSPDAVFLFLPLFH